MGGVQSTQSSMSTPAILDFIFKEMFQRSNISDLYALADPRKCSQMLILGSEALEQHFVKIKLWPRKRKGDLYFQSLPGFKTGMSAEELAEHRQNCTELAFYFIRIFQIFAALTLTIFDTELPTSNPSDEGVQREVREGKYFNPKKWEVPKPTLWDRFTGQRGGEGEALTAGQARAAQAAAAQAAQGAAPAPTAARTAPVAAAPAPSAPTAARIAPPAPTAPAPTAPAPTAPAPTAPAAKPSVLPTVTPRSLRHFSILQFLSDANLLEKADRGDWLGKIHGTHIYIKRDYDASKTNPEARIVFKREANKLKDQTELLISCDLIIEAGTTRDDFDLTVNFARTTITPQESEYEYAPHLPDTRKVTFSVNQTDFSYFQRRTRVPRYNGKTIPDYLNSLFESILRKKSTGSSNATRKNRNGLHAPDNSRSAEPFKVRPLFNALSRNPPIKAHCVARAVQLLDVNAIRGQIGEKTFSSACRTKFAYQRDGSLPTPGQDITKEMGIYAVMRLFYESLQGSMPAIADTDELRVFKENLKIVFETDKLFKASTSEPVAPEEPETENNPRIQEGGQIVEGRPSFCGSEDVNVIVPRDLASNLRKVSNALLGQQRQHIGIALNLIFKLFDRNQIVNNRKFAMSRYIVEGGMDAIDSIAREARGVLLQYYRGCEQTYRSGLQMIYDYDQRVAPLQLVGINGVIQQRNTRRNRNNEVNEDDE